MSSSDTPTMLAPAAMNLSCFTANVCASRLQPPVIGRREEVDDHRAAAQRLRQRIAEGLAGQRGRRLEARRGVAGGQRRLARRAGRGRVWRKRRGRWASSAPFARCAPAGDAPHAAGSAAIAARTRAAVLRSIGAAALSRNQPCAQAIAHIDVRRARLLRGSEARNFAVPPTRLTYPRGQDPDHAGLEHGAADHPGQGAGVPRPAVARAARSRRAARAQRRHRAGDRRDRHRQGADRAPHPHHQRPRAARSWPSTAAPSARR